eukprot:TRINITY_DN4972_c0_g1_i1.p1 TRINITY_DN4972_c0_g1~~TRINITY_DN4972_c0_g1_i1.p1  ORF type:complete len:432 (+),score=89.90 TRINITY_DN4972_c0_g1_i1:27-1298(+)
MEGHTTEEVAAVERVASCTLENLEPFKAHITQWHTAYANSVKFFVGVDIGATNTRFAVHHSNELVSYHQSLFTVQFKASSTRTIVDALQVLAAVVQEILGVEALAACLDAAGPVSTDRKHVVVTNFFHTEADRLLEVDELPANLFPRSRTVLLNDLEATCHGIKALNEESTLLDNFKVLWPPRNESETTQAKPALGLKNYVVAAVGTGLGMALLVSVGGRDVHAIVPTENGHTLVTSTAPENKLYAEETSFIKFLSAKLYNSAHSAEYEDVVSGRGLEAAYEWVAQQPEYAASGDFPRILDAAQIAAAALEGSKPESKAANRAIAIHYRYLMRVLKQLCVGMLCGGIFLAGGNQVTNNAVMETHMDELRAEFLDHPKASWVMDVNLFTQTTHVNLNLHGALHGARGAAAAVTTASAPIENRTL